jgi:hypothetical protein
MKDSTRKKGAVASAPQGDLPSLLSAVLKHPDLPVDLYNEIFTSLADLHTDKTDLTSPESIARTFGASPRTPRSIAQEREQITRAAVAVADLMEAPDTPAVLRTTLENFCTELAMHVAERGECVCSPETTREHLPMLLARAEVRGIVCANGGVMFEERGRGRG